jgi:hypothetical protein
LNRALNDQEIIAKIDKWHCMKLKKLLHMKGNNYQNEETIQRIGENLYQLFIGQRITYPEYTKSSKIKHQLIKGQMN